MQPARGRLGLWCRHAQPTRELINESSLNLAMPSHLCIVTPHKLSHSRGMLDALSLSFTVRHSRGV